MPAGGEAAVAAVDEAAGLNEVCAADEAAVADCLVGTEDDLDHVRSGPADEVEAQGVLGLRFSQARRSTCRESPGLARLAFKIVNFGWLDQSDRMSAVWLASSRASKASTQPPRYMPVWGIVRWAICVNNAPYCSGTALFSGVTIDGEVAGRSANDST